MGGIGPSRGYRVWEPWSLLALDYSIERKVHLKCSCLKHLSSNPISSLLNDYKMPFFLDEGGQHILVWCNKLQVTLMSWMADIFKNIEIKDK